MTINITQNPLDLFRQWYDKAVLSEPSDPDAACLATVDPTGLPDARVILVRSVDERGFCFFTNYESRKGQEILTSQKAALNFHWKSTEQQVRIRGTAQKVAEEESDSYYQSRPLGNQIGAWASLQSRPLDTRETLLARVEEFTEKFGETPPRPAHWGGFRLIPDTIEFWQAGEFRLHDRVIYTRTETGWTHALLYP